MALQEVCVFRVCRSPPNTLSDSSDDLQSMKQTMKTLLLPEGNKEGL